MNLKSGKTTDRALRMHLVGYLMVIIALAVGCRDESLQPGSNWIPKGIGGPVEVRPLPPASAIGEYYREWVTSEGDRKVRLFEVTLDDPANQMAFAVNIGKGETPVGRRTTTLVSFIYSNPTNGSYHFEWMVPGKQNPDWVRAGRQPKKLLLKLIQVRDVSMPRLQIVAIEGVRPIGVLIASTNVSSL